jgi:putative FmdB family regulatory protein
MPTYEFLCGKCGKTFEQTCSIEEYERKKEKRFKCLKCGSLKVVRQISAFQVKTSKKS